MSSQSTSSSREGSESLGPAKERTWDRTSTCLSLFQIKFSAARKYLAHPIPVHANEGGAPAAHCGDGLQHVPEPNQLQKCNCGSP